MDKNLQRSVLLICIYCVSLGMPTISQAHLMKAQHGTLNFKNDGVYMVLSLSSSAFNDADDDNDKRLSGAELAQHRGDMTKLISNSVTLTTKTTAIPLQGIFITPVTPHDSPESAADRIVVLGKFMLTDVSNPLQFSVELFGSEPDEQVIEITASHQAKNQQQIIKITPKTFKANLSFN